MRKTFSTSILFLFTLICIQAQVDNRKEIQFKSSDGITITGDLYEIENKAAPLILLFHQAGYSRGEYREIAPKLNALGFACLAIDQRSGNEVNGVINLTHAEAAKTNNTTTYPDAFPDLEAALNYSKNDLSRNEVIIWGSSYSSSLVFILAAKYPKQITGILSFSPGEYFKYKKKKVQDYAKKVKCPVFITSAKNEKSSWEDIYELINSEKEYFLPTKKGFHGSKALWTEKEGNEEYWETVINFLNKLK